MSKAATSFTPEKFELFLKSLGLPPEKAQALRLLPPERKVQLLQQYRETKKSQTLLDTPEFAIQVYASNPALQTLQTLQRIRMLCTYQPAEWVQKFMSLKGAQMLFQLCSVYQSPPAQQPPLPDAMERLEEIIRSVQALMRDKDTCAQLLAPTNSVTLLLYCTNLEKASPLLLTDAFKILSVCCLLPGGHARVLKDLSGLEVNKKMKRRFYSLASFLTRPVALDVKIECLTFINATINAPRSVFERVGIRDECADVGLPLLLKKLKKDVETTKNQTLLDELMTQVQIYEQEEAKDRKRFQRAYQAHAQVDVLDIDDMVRFLRRHEELQGLLEQILRHLVAIKPTPSGIEHWKQIEAEAREMARGFRPSQVKKPPSPGDVDLSDWVDMEEGGAHSEVAIFDDEEEEEEFEETLEDAIEPVDLNPPTVVAPQPKGAQQRPVSAAAAALAPSLPRVAKPPDLDAGFELLDDEPKKTPTKTPPEPIVGAPAHSAVLVDAPKPVRPSARLSSPPPVSTPPSAQPAVSSAPKLPVSSDISSLLAEYDYLDRPRASVQAVQTAHSGPANFDGSIPPPPPPSAEGPLPPPPGPGGPPPPPGGSLKRNQGPPAFGWLAKPSKKLKGLNWSKLPTSVHLPNTIFGSYAAIATAAPAESFEAVLELGQMEETFSLATPDPQAKTAQASTKKAQVTILDSKTSQNLGILLSRFKKLSHEELCAAITSMDTSVLDVDATTQLISFVPQKEIVGQFREFLAAGGNSAELGTADRFMLHFMEIGSLPLRLEALLFSLQFTPRIEAITTGFTQVLQACKLLHTSDKLKRVMELILVAGNFLNSNSFRGNCPAFRTSTTLSELPSVKGTDGKSILHYLLRTVEPKEPALATLPSDFTNLPIAAKVPTEMLVGDLNSCEKAIEAMRTQLAQVTDDTARNHIQRIIDNSSIRVQEAQQLRLLFEKAAKFTLEYFGEDSKSKIEELLTVFAQFFGFFTQSLADITKQRQVREKSALRRSTGAATGDSPNLAHKLADQLKCGLVLREQKQKSPLHPGQ